MDCQMGACINLQPYLKEEYWARTTIVQASAQECEKEQRARSGQELPGK